MNKFMNALEKIVSPIAGKLSTNVVIQSISKGMMSMMPILMLGSFASLFQSLPIDAYQNFIASTGVYGILQSVVNMTTNLLAIYGVFCIAYAFTKNKSEKNDALAAGIILFLACYTNINCGRRMDCCYKFTILMVRC